MDTRAPPAFLDALGRELADSIPDFVLVLDGDLRIAFANRCFTAFVGYTMGQLERVPLSALVPREERRRTARLLAFADGPRRFALRIVAKSGRAGSVECKAIRRGASAGGVLIVGRPLPGAPSASGPGRADGFARRALGGHDGPAFVIGCPARTILDCNAAAERVLGYARAEIVGRRLVDFARADAPTAESFCAAADEAYSRAGFYRGELVLNRKDGSAFPCLLLAVALFDAAGRVRCKVAMAFDRAGDALRDSLAAGLPGRFRELADQLAGAIVPGGATGPAGPDDPPRRLSALGFTRRQVQVARLLAEGLPSKAIGERLGVAESTVKNHVMRMLKRLGVGSRIDFLRAVEERRIRLS